MFQDKMVFILFHSISSIDANTRQRGGKMDRSKPKRQKKIILYYKK